MSTINNEVDSLCGLVIKDLKDCDFRLQFVDSVENGTDLDESSCAREGLRIVLKDLQGHLEGIRDKLSSQSTVAG